MTDNPFYNITFDALAPSVKWKQAKVKPIFLKDKKKINLKVKKVCGLEVVEEPSELSFFEDIDALLVDFEKRYTRMVRVPTTIECGAINLQSDGILSVYVDENFSQFRMTEGALYQLLNVFKIPKSFALRIPKLLLVNLINGLLKENELSVLSFFTGPSNIILSIKWHKQSEAHGIFCAKSSIGLFEGLTEKSNISFDFAVLQRSMCASFWELQEYKGKNPGVTIEVLTCDAATVGSRLSCYIYHKDGAAMIKELSFNLDEHYDSQNGLNIGAVLSMIDKIRDQAPNWLNKISKMNKVTLTDSMAQEIRALSSKMLPATVEANPGEFIGDVYRRLKELRKSVTNSLVERRRIGMFAGRLLSFVN